MKINLLSYGHSLALALLTLGPLACLSVRADEVGRVPYMGWSSWSLQATKYPGYGGGEHWQDWLTAEHVKAQADVVHQKLQKHGYTYINMDSGWASGWDEYGRPVPNAKRFPQGVAGVARYVHGLGLKMGLYFTPGIPDDLYQQNPPIQGTKYHVRDIVFEPRRAATGWRSNHKIDYSKPGAQEYIDSLAARMTSWGMDFLKLDGVTPGSDINGDEGLKIDARPDVAAWGKALKRTGRPVWLELSWAIDGAFADDWRPYANGWRANDDVETYGPTLTAWGPILRRVNVTRSPVAKPGGGWVWNDLDSVDVACGAMDGLTPDERQTVMTLWAIQCAPLFTGDDLTKMDDEGLRLLTNDEVIAVDHAGRPATLIVRGKQQIRYARNADGSVTAALFNLADDKATVTLTGADVGIQGPMAVRDLWSHTNLGAFPSQVTADVPPHGARLLRLTPRRSVPPRFFQIVRPGDGRRLSVRDGSTNDAARLALVADGGDSSLWSLVPGGDGLALVNKRSGKLVNIPGPTQQAGTPLIQYPDDGNANSRWRMQSGPGGLVSFVSPYDGQFLAAQGDTVVQTPPGDGPPPLWRLVPVR